MHFVVKEAINSKIAVIKVLLVKYVKNVHVCRIVGQKMKNLGILLQCLRGPIDLQIQCRFILHVLSFKMWPTCSQLEFCGVPAPPTKYLTYNG